MKGSAGPLVIEEKSLSPCDNSVVVETNRWDPDRCMWTVSRENMAGEDLHVIFPFPELWAAACHIIIGTVEDYCCFIHLTPLTSLFRISTDEVEKINLNLDLAISNGRKKDWTFRVYYFADDDRENRFRSLLAKVLGKKAVTCIPIIPRNAPQGAFSLIYYNGRLYVSTQVTDLLSCKDCSDKGTFKTVPIEAIE